MSNLDIANTILKQLGGLNRLRAMTGAKDALAIDNGVQFKIGRNAEGVNTIRITLNAMDTYDVEYGRVRNVKRVPTYKVLVSEPGIYNDMLISSFERNTGMYLTF